MDPAVSLFTELDRIWRLNPRHTRLEILAADLAARLASESAPRLVARRSYDAARMLLGLRPLLNSYGLDLLGRIGNEADTIFVLLDHRYQPAPFPPAVVRQRIVAAARVAPRPLVVLSPTVTPGTTTETAARRVESCATDRSGVTTVDDVMEDDVMEDDVMEDDVTQKGAAHTLPVNLLPEDTASGEVALDNSGDLERDRWQPAAAALSIVWRELVGAPRRG